MILNQHLDLVEEQISVLYQFYTSWPSWAVKENWVLCALPLLYMINLLMHLICLGSFLCILQEIGLKDSMRPLRP